MSLSPAAKAVAHAIAKSGDYHATYRFQNGDELDTFVDVSRNTEIYGENNLVTDHGTMIYIAKHALSSPPESGDEIEIEDKYSGEREIFEVDQIISDDGYQVSLLVR